MVFRPEREDYSKFYVNMVTPGCYYEGSKNINGCVWLLPTLEPLCGNLERCTVKRPTDQWKIQDGKLVAIDGEEHLPWHVDVNPARQMTLDCY